MERRDRTEGRQGGAGPGARRAFSLLELMFAVAIASVVILGTAVTFTVHSRTYRSQRMVRDMQQNVRHGMAALTRDIRMAGYGLAVPRVDIPLWLSWAPGMTNNPLVRPGATASAPDAISIAAAFDPPVAALATNAPKGATVLALQAGQGARFNTTDRKVIAVGRCETARIIGIAGDVLTISTHPTVMGRGLRQPYGAGDPIEIVKVVTYAWHFDATNYPGLPCLIRDEGAGATTNWWACTVAEGIEDLQFSATGYAVAVRMTARTREEDPTYTDKAAGDHYRRMTVSTEVLPRNSPLLVLRY